MTTCGVCDVIKQMKSQMSGISHEIYIWIVLVIQCDILQEKHFNLTMNYKDMIKKILKTIENKLLYFVLVVSDSTHLA